MTTYNDTIGVSFGAPKTTDRELNSNYLNITTIEDMDFTNLELNDSFYLDGGYQEQIDFSHLFGNFSLAAQSFIFNTVGELDFKPYSSIKDLIESTLSFGGNLDFALMLQNSDFTLFGGYQERINFVSLLGQLSLTNQSFIFNTVGELDFKSYFIVPSYEKSSGTDFKIGILIPPNIYILQ